MDEKGSSGKKNRGLASADAATRQRVARAGGEARHMKRGLQAADEKTRERVARAGGEASRGGGGSKRDSIPESTMSDTTSPR